LPGPRSAAERANRACAVCGRCAREQGDLSAQATNLIQQAALHIGLPWLTNPSGGRLPATGSEHMPMAVPTESPTPQATAPNLGVSEAEYRLLVDNVQDYAIFTLDPTGHIRTWNHGAAGLFGYAEAEALGQPSALIFTPEDRSAGAPTQEMDTARTQGQALDERWHVRQSGQRFWGSGTMVALWDSAGALCGYAKNIRDDSERQQLGQTLRQREAQFRQLAAEIVLAEQQERERIAQLLHDDLQQLLYALQIHLNLLHADVVDLTPPHLLPSFQESEAMIGQIIQLTGQLTVDLSPPVLQSEGLVEMLEWLASHMQQLYGLTIAVEAQVNPQWYSPELRIFLFQLVRELLFNVVKHAGVKQAQVTVQAVADQLVVQVSDPGQGFDVARALAAPHPGGYGLRSIQQRLALFHGQLLLRSQPGTGTEVTIRLPRHPPGLRAST
jgi:PAS domain S-box-containing protein